MMYMIVYNAESWPHLYNWWVIAYRGPSAYPGKTLYWRDREPRSSAWKWGFWPDLAGAHWYSWKHEAEKVAFLLAVKEPGYMGHLSVEAVPEN